MLADLWIGEGVVTAPPLKARIPRRLALLHAAEERLVGALHPQQHILQHLGIDLRVLRAGRLQIGRFSLLLVVRRALALPPFPPDAALLQGGIVEHTAAPQGRLQSPLLVWGRPEFVLVSFMDSLLVHRYLCC